MGSVVVGDCANDLLNGRSCQEAGRGRKEAGTLENNSSTSSSSDRVRREGRFTG